MTIFSPEEEARSEQWRTTLLATRLLKEAQRGNARDASARVNELFQDHMSNSDMPMEFRREAALNAVKALGEDGRVVFEPQTVAFLGEFDDHEAKFTEELRPYLKGYLGENSYCTLRKYSEAWNEVYFDPESTAMDEYMADVNQTRGVDLLEEPVRVEKPVAAPEPVREEPMSEPAVDQGIDLSRAAALPDPSDQRQHGDPAKDYQALLPSMQRATIKEFQNPAKLAQPQRIPLSQRDNDDVEPVKRRDDNEMSL